MIVTLPASDTLIPTVPFSRSQLNPPEEFDGRNALRAGTRLAEFEVLSVLGTGGFGIVYLALDHLLKRQVAIKEYMPSALAVRGIGERVVLRAPQHSDAYAAGRKSFINEAQLLASFDHPSLLKVHRYWEDNNTAYMVMQYYPGRTLKQERLAMTQPPTEAWLRALVEPLLDALEVLHREGIYHRDISPDNILLQLDGPPVLLDFGAARKVVSQHSQALTAILKPNFAPVEQYADIVGMRQGPWTDLYALAAVLRYMLTGQPPVPAVARAVRDGVNPLVALRTGVSKTFLKAVDWALSVAPEDRPQNVKQMRDALSGRLKPPRRLRIGGGWRWPEPRWAWASAAFAGLLVVTLTGWAWRKGPAPAVAAQPASVVAAVTPRPSEVLAAPAAGRPSSELNDKAGATAADKSAEKPAETVASAKPSATMPAKPPAKPQEKAQERAQERATPKVAASPDEACTGRNFFMKAWCVNRECAKDRFTQHPTCVQLRRDKEKSERSRERGG